MKLGLFSDIHANRDALARVVELLRGLGATSFLCAGDVVGYGPDPAACVGLLRELGVTVVAGNHDRAAVGREGPAGFNSLAREVLEWTTARLTRDDAGYLDALPLAADAGPFHLVHASPSDPGNWRYICSAEDAEPELDAFSLPACVIGHSHRPLVVERQGGEIRTLRATRFELRPGARYLVNVGSVGQPRDGDRRACCALYDTDSREFNFHRVEYDIERVQRRMRRARLPDYLVTRLARGR
ncbi:MAG: metallophosphoesterase family protein [bacterium]